MAKNNRFKKKALEEEAKNIVSSVPVTTETENSNETTIKDEVLSEKVLSTKNEVEPDVTSSVKSSTTKIVIEKEKKIEMTKLGTSIKMTLKKNLDKEAKKYSRTPNNIVNILLDNLYDEKTKTFDIKIGKKDTSKITSYHIKNDHYKAIEKLCKQSGYNKSEIFNMLIEKGLSNLK